MIKILLFNFVFIFSTFYFSEAHQQCLDFWGPARRVSQVSIFRPDFSQRNAYSKKISNLLRVSLYNGFTKDGTDSSQANEQALNLVDSLFSSPQNMSSYLSAIRDGTNLSEVDTSLFRDSQGVNFVADLNPQQLQLLFLVGKSLKSKRQAIQTEIAKIENLLPPSLRTPELINNSFIGALLFLKVFEPTSLLLEYTIRESRLSDSVLREIDTYVVDNFATLRNSAELQSLFYLETYQPPAEFTPFNQAPQSLARVATRSLRRIFISREKASAGITLISLGRDHLFVTMAHNLRYIERTLSLEREQNSQAQLLFENNAGQTEALTLEPVREISITDNPEMAIVVLRIMEMPNADIPVATAPAIVGEPVHIFGFPAPRRMVRSVTNDGVLNPDYSSGTVQSVDGSNITTTALASMGSSGSVALNALGQIIGILWDLSDSFRAVKTDSESVKAAYDFGNLLAPQDYSYFVPLHDMIDH